LLIRDGEFSGLDSERVDAGLEVMPTEALNKAD